MQRRQLLKKDQFGEIWLLQDGQNSAVLRDTRNTPWWTASIARYLLRREKRVLAALTGFDGVPQFIAADKQSLTRTFIAGTPLYDAPKPGKEFFKDASRLLRRLHAANVTHNDLAKEPNILVQPDGKPAFIDFQLASIATKRGRLFRLAGREDIRHLLKHKRTYQRAALSNRERHILARPSVPSRIWMGLFKPAYLFVTRRLFGWADREGAADRGRHN